jgi:HEAT repeat protein
MFGTNPFSMEKNTLNPSYEGRSAKSWLRDLDLDAPAAESEAAERAFAAMGIAVVPWLVNEFTTDNLPDRRGARLARAFHALGSQANSAIPDLIRLVEKHPDRITYALAGIGEEAGPPLIHLLRTSSELVRVRACEALKNALLHRRVQRSVVIELIPDLIALLKHHWHLLRWRSASLIGTIRAAPEQCIPALIRSLEDRFPEVQGAAALALGHFGDAAVAALPRLLELSRAEDRALRSSVLSALGGFSDPLVLPVLIDALHDPKPNISTSAIYSIGRRKWPANILVPELCNCVRDGGSVMRWAATEILARFGEQASAAVPVLRTTMASAHPALRELILKALERIEKSDPKRI